MKGLIVYLCKLKKTLTSANALNVIQDFLSSARFATVHTVDTTVSSATVCYSAHSAHHHLGFLPTSHLLQRNAATQTPGINKEIVRFLINS